MTTILFTLLIYWLTVFVACFVVVEVGHDQLYDEITPYAGFKVTGGSLLIAILLTWYKARGTPASFESMFTTNIIWTVLQGIVWVAVFMLVLRFHPWHALGLGLATMLMVPGLATMGVDGILARPARTSTAAQPFTPKEPVRSSLTAPLAKPAETAK